MGKIVQGIKFIGKYLVASPLDIEGVLDTGTTTLKTIRGFIEVDLGDLEKFAEATAKIQQIKADLAAIGELQGDFKTTVGGMNVNDDGTAEVSTGEEVVSSPDDAGDETPQDGEQVDETT